MRLTDNDIVTRIRNGESHQYGRLVERYKDKGMTLAVRMLRSREDAEEVLQDAFVRAYNGLEKFRGSSSFGTWFYRILYNACLSRLEQRHPERSFAEYDEEDPGLHVPDEGNALSHLERDELSSRIRETIETLPEMYAAILTMFYLQERTHEEICEITELPLGTVKVRLFRARALLQERLSAVLTTEGIRS